MATELTLLEVLQQIVRDELRSLRFPEPAVVIDPAPEVKAGGENHYHCDVKLRRTGLELANVPIAAGRRGEVALPSPGDLVLVSFLGGDINAPVITGRLYAADDAVPAAKPGEYVYEQPEPKQQGLRRLHLKFPSGTTLTADDEQIELHAGGTRVLVKQDGDVAIESKGAISLQADGTLAIRARGDVAIESGTGKVSVKAATSATLEGGAAAEVKAPSVKLKGQTDFSPS